MVLPAHAPGDEGALSGLTAQRQQDRRGDFAIIAGQLESRLAVPFMQVIGGPLRGLVEMTKIARIGAANVQRRACIGAVDVVIPDSFEETVSSVGHVAIDAETAGRCRRVMSMGLKIVSVSLVALKAC